MNEGSVVSVEWHLACNLPCGVNVCRPPHSLDNTLGGNFAWRVDQLKADGNVIQGEVWDFSLVQTVSYSERAVADTYINKKKGLTKHYDKRHMIMRSKTTKNPMFGFVKFNLPPPTYAGLGDCEVSVLSADLRLTVLSTPMQNVSVYLIASDKEGFDESQVTSENHPG